jgi:hypothetical protein
MEDERTAAGSGSGSGSGSDEGTPGHGADLAGPGIGGSPTAAGTGADPNEDRAEALADPDVRALVDELRSDEDRRDVRVDPATAAEQVGDGTDA